MAWKFGAATGDDISHTTTLAGPVNSSAMFFAGWFYPTTLTAGRVYFAPTTVSQIRVGTTTSAIDILNDRTTTDAVYSIAAGIVVNKWHFIAIAINVSSAGVSTIHAWIGTVETPPSPTPIVATVTTAGSGNSTGANARCVGNASTAGTVAFQGNIGQLVLIATGQSNLDGLCITSNSGITTDDDANIYNMLVQPLYNGFLPQDMMRNLASQNHEGIIYDLSTQPPTAMTWYRGSSAVSASPVVLTANGATWTEERPPKEWQVTDLRQSRGRH